MATEPFTLFVFFPPSFPRQNYTGTANRLGTNEAVVCTCASKLHRYSLGRLHRAGRRIPGSLRVGYVGQGRSFCNFLSAAQTNDLCYTSDGHVIGQFPHNDHIDEGTDHVSQAEKPPQPLVLRSPDLELRPGSLST